MRIGISMSSLHLVSDPREGARNMVERARAARDAGLDSLFVGDHHTTPRPYYQNTAILGRLLAEWNAKPAGALYLLPLHHPVLLAELLGTLAAIAQGPFVLQCALGAADLQYQAMGVNPKHRPSRFEQSLDCIRRLCAGEEVSLDGRWRFSGARISPIPPQPLEVWIGASVPAAIDRAARLGDGWIGSPHLVADAAREQLAHYRERCGAHGRAVGTAVLRRDVYVGADAREGRATTEPIVAAGYRGFDPRALVIGSAQEVAEQLAGFAEMGYDEVLVRNLVADQAHAVACIGRLAEVRRLLGG